MNRVKLISLKSIGIIKKSRLKVTDKIYFVFMCEIFMVTVLHHKSWYISEKDVVIETKTFFAVKICTHLLGTLQIVLFW